MKLILIPSDRRVYIFDEDLGIPVRVERRTDYKMAVMSEQPANVQVETPRERAVGQT